MNRTFRNLGTATLFQRLAVSIVLLGAVLLEAGAVFGQTTSTGSGQAASTGSGQAYPNKPVRIIASSVGSGGDIVARLIAQGLTATLGQQVIVDNRGGAGGLIAGEIVSKSLPDGYTLLIYGGTIWLAPLLRDKTPYSMKDFSPVTLAVSSPSILVVSSSVAANSVRELIELARSRPGELNYSSSGTGATNHLAAELFKAMAGVDIVRVNYKGNAPALNAVIAAQIQMTFGIVAVVTPHVKLGKLRALAVTSTQPSELFPGLPTVAASGLPGYEAVAMFAVLAPAKTPLTVINRLNQETLRFLKTPEVKQKFLSVGAEVVGSSPQELAAKIASEVARMGKVIKDAGIRDE